LDDTTADASMKLTMELTVNIVRTYECCLWKYYAYHRHSGFLLVRVISM